MGFVGLEVCEVYSVLWGLQGLGVCRVEGYITF